MSLSDDGFLGRFQGLGVADRLAMVAESCERRAALYDKKVTRAEDAGKPTQVRQNKLKRDKWRAYASTVRSAGENWL